MKTHLSSLTLTALLALSFSVAGCSKKTEPANPPPAPEPAATTTNPAQPLADAARARVEAAQKEMEAAKAQAEAAAKAKAAELQAQADQKIADAQRAANDLKAQGTSQANALLGSLSTQKTDAQSTPSTTGSLPALSSLPALTQNLNPVNFSAWYDKANAESSGIISSLATKAAELGSQASPEFKSLYNTAVAQKKTFDEVSAQVKAGGLMQWASLYPKLQTSWTDLSKSLTDAQALLGQFQK